MDLLGIGIERAKIIASDIIAWIESIKEGVPKMEQELKPTPKKVFLYNVYEELMKRHTIKTFDNDIIHCFDGLVYRECESDLAVEIYDIAKTIQNDGHVEITSNDVKEILFRIKATTRSQTVRRLAITFKNGVLDWETFIKEGKLKLTPPDPNNPSFFFVPRNVKDVNEGWDIETMAKAVCPRVLETFKAWAGDNWQILFEILGFSLYPGYPLHKAFILYGEGGNGKSTYIRVLENAIGHNNVAHVGLHELEERFSMIQLYNKLLNTYADLPARKVPFPAIQRFKMLTGNDEVTADRKFRDPIKFINIAKMIFSTNTIPRASIEDMGFMRRWVIIEFPNKFTGGFQDFSEEEYDGLVTVSLYAFREVLKRNSFSFSKTVEDLTEEWKRNSDPVYDFIAKLREGVEVDGEVLRSTEGATPQNELYELFLKVEGKSMDKSTFTRRLANLGIQLMKNAKKSYYTIGIETVETEENEDQDNDRNEEYDNYIMQWKGKMIEMREVWGKLKLEAQSFLEYCQKKDLCRVEGDHVIF